MRFLKESIVIGIIVIFMAFIEILTVCLSNKNFKKIEDDVDFALKENSTESIDLLENEWEKTKCKLSFFLEHDELEKVSLKIVEAKSNIEKNEEEVFFENLNDIKFLIEHIKDKSSLKLYNIF